MIYIIYSILLIYIHSSKLLLIGEFKNQFIHLDKRFFKD